MRNRLSPQQKKQYSYAKDRRNSYGERGANSRFAIRENKLHGRRATRRAEDQALHAALSVRDEVELALVEHGVRSQPASRGHFHKRPDAPLGQVVAGKLSRREAHRLVAREDGADLSGLPAQGTRRLAARRWHLDPSEVLTAWSGGGAAGRTHYCLTLTLTHAPTGISARAASAKGNYTRARATATRQALYAELFLRLERLVARHLRVPGVHN